jgi:DNA invertase Pin-like site-specific DNA recombinase
MSATNNAIFATNAKVKSLAIVFCRLSRLPDATRGVLSLDSQEFAILQALQEHGIGVYVTIKMVGSAYNAKTGCEPQRQLINTLKNSKNKIVYVYEPNRLSRNVAVFDEIMAVCHKNKHRVFVVTLGRVFEDLTELRPFIVQAERESREIGDRISRTNEFKKSREPAWGKMRNERDEIVDCPREQAISHLIRLLGTAGSSVAEIERLVNQLADMTNKEPFALVEYDSNGDNEIHVSTMPYGMAAKNIADTLKYYEIRHRKRLNWTTREIYDIIMHKPSGRFRGYDSSMDDLARDFEILGESKEETKTESKEETKAETQWIYVWYDPAIGLPPNVRLPPGMRLPTHQCELCIPKM